MVLATLEKQSETGNAAARSLTGPGRPTPADSGSFTAGSLDHGPVEAEIFHRPVMVQEALHYLNGKDGGVYLDATLGEGGHSRSLLSAVAPTGRVVGLDRDPRSLEQAQRRLAPFSDRFTAVQASYTGAGEVCRSLGIDRVDGVLMDLGISSRQLEAPGYGFSFQADEPLDMRFDPEQPLTAADIVNSYSREELADVIYRYGEERNSRAIARQIVQARPLNTTVELAQAVSRGQGRAGRGRRAGIHPATRTFQALRIAVNSELDHLEDGLTEAMDLLAPEGRLVVISYHSLEDRIVKTALGLAAARCVCPPEAPICVCGRQPTMSLVTRKVIKPSPQELEYNTRSRSARMRVAQRR